jgi:hypothetical protein
MENSTDGAFPGCSDHLATDASAPNQEVSHAPEVEVGPHAADPGRCHWRGFASQMNTYGLTFRDDDRTAGQRAAALNALTST